MLAEKITEAVAAATALPRGGERLPDLARFVGSRVS
jgi:hypothetical protein